MSRILIVDDDSMAVRMIGFILKKTGHDFFSASSGAQGVALLKSEKTDLMLLDVEMPGENGLDVLEKIRGDSGISDTNVCLMSGTITDDLRERAEKLGAVGFIGKPVSAPELMDVLSRTEI
ncbi:response regulator [Ruminococcus albus]|uniref:Stage 0 sporulation protein A homolog n=1 Tax=Ruminococcus albus TaxID=1264 RepID=A0A1H7N7E2_RUMAL|nr:response regulator [Ruminococcus albus]SEL19526.1 two-component system, OmpR family, alkaline phosphatase synthesis response regulator PhoP [Ruminococcus albus]